MSSYLVLFTFAFLAATILPFSSEAVLFTLIRQGADSLLLLICAAAGNTLGAAVNWCLGRFFLHYQDRPWFYFTTEQVARMQHWFQRYGVWSLLLSWMPLGGDVLTFIAGIMRVNFWIFLLLVGIGKTLRYIVILFLANGA